MFIHMCIYIYIYIYVYLYLYTSLYIFPSKEYKLRARMGSHTNEKRKFQ